MARPFDKLTAHHGRNRQLTMRFYAFLGTEPLQQAVPLTAESLVQSFLKLLQDYLRFCWRKTEKIPIGTLVFIFLFLPTITVAGEQNNGDGLALTPEEIAWIREYPNVRYGAEKDWPPYDFVDKEGKHTGLSRDMLDLVGKYSGLTFQPEVAQWDELLRKAKAKKIELLPCLFDTKERQVYLSFTEPYHTALDYFFIHEEVQAKTLDDLNGKTIAIPKGYAQIEEIKQRYPKLRILETDGPMSSIQPMCYLKFIR